MIGPSYLAITFTGAAALLVPFLMAAAVSSLVFFLLKARHKKKHPDEEYLNETNRQRREREKLKQKTVSKVTNKLRGGDSEEKESAPNGLRSGKYKKKKGKH